MKFTIKNSFAGSILLVGALALAACSPSNENDSAADMTEDAVTSPTASSDSTTADADADQILSVSDAVVRASVEGSPMTAIFGTIANNSEEEVTITGFTASVDAMAYEVHEVVDGVMREKEGGFTIPAGESYELAPGKDHLMLMGLSEPVEAGDTVDVTLILDDGSEIELDPVPVRTIAAGDESYSDDGGLMGHSGVDDSAQ